MWVAGQGQATCVCSKPFLRRINSHQLSKRLLCVLLLGNFFFFANATEKENTPEK